MARLVADKHTEAVVRQANARRLKVWQAEVERTETPLLAWGGVAEPVPAAPQPETVDDRLELRRRGIQGTARRSMRDAEKDAQWTAAAHWYRYLCTLHPAAPTEGLSEFFAQRARHGGPLMAYITARKTYAKLIAGHPVQDDFTVVPAPWLDISRRHWRNVEEIPPEVRKTGLWKATMAAEVDAWKAAHPEEVAAWVSQNEARQQRQAVQVDYDNVRYAGG
jgi:hypothetical protein